MILAHKLPITNQIELRKIEARISTHPLQAVLTDRPHDREFFMNGIDGSYHYEGCPVIPHSARPVTPRSAKPVIPRAVTEFTAYNETSPFLQSDRRGEAQ